MTFKSQNWRFPTIYLGNWRFPGSPAFSTSQLNKSVFIIIFFNLFFSIQFRILDSNLLKDGGRKASGPIGLVLTSSHASLSTDLSAEFHYAYVPTL